MQNNTSEPRAATHRRNDARPSNQTCKKHVNAHDAAVHQVSCRSRSNRVSQAGALDTQAAFAAAVAIRRRLAEKDSSNPAADAARHSGRSLHFEEGLVVRSGLRDLR